MKRYITLIALAAIAIGCSKSEVTTAPGQGVEITINPYFGKAPVSKAVSADVEYLQGFNATATPAFHVNAFLHTAINVAEGATMTDADLNVISENNIYMDENVWYSNDAWAYDGKVYWPDPLSGIKLAFSAYSLNAVTLTTAPAADDTEGGILFNEGSYTKFTYYVPKTVEKQEDLLATPVVVNQGIGETAGESADVSLEFKHLLSRIGFKLVSNNNDDDINIDIKEVTLKGNFAKSGTVNLMSLTPAITPVQESIEASYTLFPEGEFCRYASSTTEQVIFAKSKTDTDGNVVDTGKDKGTDDTTLAPEDINRFMMIIPCDPGDDAKIEVKYQLTDAEEQTAEVSLKDLVFAAGKSYEFVFKVSTLAIGVYVEISEWDSAETSVHPLVPDMK